MIIIYACAVVLGIEAVLLRRRLLGLARLPVRRLWLVWLALADQVLVISVLPGGDSQLLAGAHLLSYLVAAVFVWVNRHIAGLWLTALGGVLNVIAIAANGGRMPAARQALRASGWHPAAGHFANSGVVAHAHFARLGDIFATPRWLPGHDVFSVGDVLIVAGVAWLVYRNCTPGRSRQRAVPQARVQDRATAPRTSVGSTERRLTPEGGPHGMAFTSQSERSRLR
jgi:hypothetical protein